MTEKEKHTEEKIAEAAREVFIEKGMDGARMQEIADKAGINKSLLHYYFRSKEKLFNFVLSKIMSIIGSRLGVIMQEDVAIIDKVKAFVDLYTDLLLKNPFLPNFIFNEITRNPDGLIDRFSTANIKPGEFIKPLERQLKKEGYSINPHDFVLNLLSMVIFPVAGRPIIQILLFEGDSSAYKKYIVSRKESIVTYVMYALEGYRIKQ
ncbi:MAG: TetR/AcrR family transcriptional regulator [Salinivirgaceae bacterium]|nr:TetR/AcrR family transcriptional regulator [Salinivirgaceae bacterium]